MTKIRNDLQAAASAFGNIQLQVLSDLLRNPKVQSEIIFNRSYSLNYESFLSDIAAGKDPQINKTVLQNTISRIEADMKAGTARQFQIDELPVLKQELSEIDLLASPVTLRPEQKASLFTGNVNINTGLAGGQSVLERLYLTRLIRDTATLQKAIDLAGGTAFMDKIIEKRTAPFMKLINTGSDAFDKISQSLQLSLTGESKTRKVGDNEYAAKLLLGYGLPKRVDLTMNWGFNYTDSKTIGGDKRGGDFSGQLDFPVRLWGSSNLVDPDYTLNFSFSGEGKWMTKTGPTYKVQGKLKVTLADGFEIPFSVTYANRTDLIKENDVRGQFGFSIDPAKLFRLAKFNGIFNSNQQAATTQAAPSPTGTAPGP
ncbi:MAG: hypothetical protein M3362_07820 [Acidobacteriota bacterium]|nr:hypothetical protein [Acidobacteriota bacterium]